MPNIIKPTTVNIPNILRTQGPIMLPIFGQLQSISGQTIASREGISRFFSENKYIDVCYNMMCLSPNDHRYHGKAYVALKPVTRCGDGKSLTVKLSLVS